MRLIDADRLIKEIPETMVSAFERCDECELLDAEQVKELIDRQPTAKNIYDIIRCRECVYYEADESGDWGKCENTGAGMPAFGFCSDGTREAEEKIIHCKDCAYYDCTGFEDVGWCCYLEDIMRPHEYCSRGEREEESDDQSQRGRL